MRWNTEWMFRLLRRGRCWGALRRQVERGESPSKAKVEKRTALAEAFTFGGWAEAYFKHKADPKSGAEKTRRQHPGDAPVRL